MKILAVIAASLRRVARDRVALFFMIVLPIVVIVIVGATARGFNTYRVGVVNLGAGATGQALTHQLEHTGGLAVHVEPSVSAASDAVRRSQIDVALVLPVGMDRELQEGHTVQVGLLNEQANSAQQAAAAAVQAAIARYGGRVQAAQFATTHNGRSYAANTATASALQQTTPKVVAHGVSADANQQILPQGYNYSAPTMLVLFIFINALAGAAIIVENRRLGMYERMLSGPVRVSSVIFGEAASFGVIALVQAVLIVAVGAFVFGVSWGNPLAATVLIVDWALVGAGAGMLAGTVFRTPEQASAIGPALGIAFGMLGGCMWPLAIVGSTMRTVGHIAPQAWAVDAWTDLLSRHGTVATIAPQLLVIATFALGFLGLAWLRLRHKLTG